MGEPRSATVDARALFLRFVGLVAATLTVAMAAYLAWSVFIQDEATQDKVLSEARALSRQLQASWDYIDEAQYAINYNSDGSYDFKGVYCAVAGRSIARKFTQRSEGYSIRFVREDPRSVVDEPDDYEMKVLKSFEDDSVQERYGEETLDGQPVFRYVARLEIERGCLQCHGDPIGEKDPVGYLKEGMAIGDVAGAVSVVIPLAAYERDAVERIALSLCFFAFLVLIMALVVHFALKAWVVSPLREMNAKLERENRRRENFLTIISHEFRTPLTSIKAFAELWEGSESPKNEEELMLVGEIKQGTDALLGTLNNIIDAAHVESGKYHVAPEEIDMVDLAQAVKAMLSPLAASKGISLTASVSEDVPIVVSDWDALNRILLNLAGNALKYTSGGGLVSIDVFFDDENDVVLVRVADNGCGIAAADLERVFDRFEQVGQDEQSKEIGNGLGLFLSMSLARLIGGSLSVESIEGEGSAFTLRIPVRAEVSECGETSGEDMVQS